MITLLLRIKVLKNVKTPPEVGVKEASEILLKTDREFLSIFQ